MHSKLPELLFLLAIPMLFVSCVEDVNLGDQSGVHVVVNCILSPDTVQTLKLTYSNPLGKIYYTEVDSAQAFLYNDSLLVGEFKKYTYGQWQIKYRPLINKRYRLVVNIPGKPVITATTTVPDYVKVEKDTKDDNGATKHFIQKAAPTHYWIFVIGYDKTQVDSLIIRPVVAPDNKLREEIGTDHVDADHFNTENEWSTYLGPDITTSPFMYYIRINKNKSDVPEYKFYIDGAIDYSMVFFRSASNEYDEYMKSSFQKMLVYQSFDDPTQWFDENVVYSNINNGIGIFAAYTDHVIYYDPRIFY